MGHPALLYSDLHGFLSHVQPFVDEGIRRGEPVVAAVGAEELEALEGRFGRDTAGVRLVDTREWHPHTGTRLRAFHQIVTEALAEGAEHVRLVGEPAWPSGFPELEHEWTRYESALNAVLEPFPVTLVCTYPRSRLHPSIVESAARTHPEVVDGDARTSREYVEPDALLQAWTPALPPPPAGARVLSAPQNLAVARRFVLEQATRAGVDEDRARCLQVAANEVLTNALVHADGTVSLRVWSDGDRFVCEVVDRGPGIDDPLVGYRPPEAATMSGRGLWIVRQLVDLLQIAPGSTGTTVRLHVRARAA